MVQLPLLQPQMFETLAHTILSASKINTLAKIHKKSYSYSTPHH